MGQLILKNMEIMILEEWELGREFILAALNQTLQVRSVDEIKEIIKLAFEYVDTNLSLSYILSYLVFAIDFNTENLRLEQLPGESVYTNGVWVFKANKDESSLLFDGLKFNEY